MNQETTQSFVIALLSVFAAVLVALNWQRETAPADRQVATWLGSTMAERNPIAPLPPAPVLDPGKVALGERLFHDPILSRDDTVSCASCHDLERAGTDGLARSRGIGGASGLRNAPTVFNASLDFAQFRDGRANTLEDQVAGPIHDALEMGSDWNEVIRKLSAHPEYPGLFAGTYRKGITETTVANAIATFERSLLTPDAPFDRYLIGDRDAVDPEVLEGYQLFLDRGCASCHQGANVGGNMLQRFGTMGDYFGDLGNAASEDLGRFNITGQEDDRRVFKVPSLRNVAVTPPYFHDGSIADLDRAISIMGRYQLGQTLADEEVRLIRAFLHSLTGRYRGEALK